MQAAEHASFTTSEIPLKMRGVMAPGSPGYRTVHLRHVPLTVSMYTANMGPHSRGWYLPYRVQWRVLGREGLLLAVPLKAQHAI